MFACAQTTYTYARSRSVSCVYRKVLDDRGSIYIAKKCGKKGWEVTGEPNVMGVKGVFL